MIRASFKTLAHHFQISVSELHGLEFALEFKERALPGSMTPVLRKKAQNRQLELMRFSMIPSWSKEKKLKFATHNARLEGIETKPTWRKVFVDRHCVVALDGFIEPAYSGPLAGNMIQFKPNTDQILNAAAIWDEWVDPQTGEVIHSFAILTREPSPFIHEYGHDRTPVFLPDSKIEEWISMDSAQLRDAKKTHDFLNSEAIHPSLAVSVDRPLKAGWNK